MASNQISVAVGAAMIVAGVGLWGVAASAQLQRARAVPSNCTDCTSPPCPACPPCPERPACPGLAPPASASAPPAASSAAASASVSASAPPDAPPGSAEEGELFRFDPGKPSFQKQEIPRLLAHVRELAKQPQIKIQIEGIGEEEGPRGLALGRSRSVIARMLLVEAGIDGERLVLSPPQTRASAEQSGVRIRPLEVKNP